MKQNRLTATSHLLIGVGVFITMMILMGLLAFGLYGIGMEDLADQIDLIKTASDHPLGLKFFNFLSSSLPFIAAAIVLPLLFKAHIGKYLLLSLPSNLKYFGLSIVFIFLSVILMGPLMELNSMIDFDFFSEGLQEKLALQDGESNKTYDLMTKGDGILNFVSMLLFMAVMPALAEELFFRGFLMNVGHGVFKNIHISILFSAIIFSAIHMQFMKIIPMTFLAIGFGYAVYWTNSIWTAVIAHGFNNAFAVTMLKFSAEGEYDKLLEQDKEYSWIMVIPAIIGIIALFIYMQKNAEPKAINFYE